MNISDEAAAMIEALNACDCGHLGGACMCHRKQVDELPPLRSEAPYPFALLGDLPHIQGSKA